MGVDSGSKSAVQRAVRSVHNHVLVLVLIAAAASLAEAAPKRGSAASRPHDTVAVAEPGPWRTVEAVAVRKRPGTRSAVIGHLTADTVVTIEQRRASWIRVRVRVGARRKKTIVGYLPRAAITSAAPAMSEERDEDAARAARGLDARTTIEAVVVRKKPGEKQAAAGELPAGTEVVIEGEQGRWLRVRAGRITGYVTRTTLTAAARPPEVLAVSNAPSSAYEPDSQLAVAPAVDETIRPATSWRAKATATALVATVTAPSSALRSGPAREAAEVAKANKGARLIVIDARGTPGWVHVRDTGGHDGWISQRELGNGADMVAGTDDGTLVRSMPEAVAVAGVEPHRSWSLRIGAGAGYRALGSEVMSRATDAPSDQRTSAGGGTAEVALDAVARPARSLSVGVDARIDSGRSAAAATRGLDVGLRAGFRPRPIFELSLRAGARSESSVSAAMGVSERLAGATIGVRLDVTPARSRVTATLQVDSLFGGRWKHDQTDSKARALWAGMTIGVRIMRGLSLHTSFDLGRATTTWSQMSMSADPATARRTDTTQVLQFGISGAL